jgi:anhydro-N-acetylmuramic acid kinase
MPSGEHPLSRVWMQLARGEAIVAGVLSGTSPTASTSLSFVGRCRRAQPIAFATQPFRPRCRRACAPRSTARASERASWRSVARSRPAFGRAAATLADEQRLELDLVGSHGQTVCTTTASSARARRRCSSATAISSRGDGRGDGQRLPHGRPWRCGGEARRSPPARRELFPDLPRPSVSEPGRHGERDASCGGRRAAGLRHGPANALLDGLARALLNAPVRPRAARSRCAVGARSVCGELLQHPFFARRPPKSTGRDTFGAP